MAHRGRRARSQGAAIWVKPLAALFVSWRWPWRGPECAASGSGTSSRSREASPPRGSDPGLAGLGRRVQRVLRHRPELLADLRAQPDVAPPSLVLLHPRRYAALRLWAAGGALVLWLVSRDYPRLAWLGGGALLGTLAIVLQGKGFYYHIYPMALFAVMLGAAGTAVAIARRRRGAALALLALLCFRGPRSGSWASESGRRIDRAHAEPHRGAYPGSLPGGRRKWYRPAV